MSNEKYDVELSDAPLGILEFIRKSSRQEILNATKLLNIYTLDLSGIDQYEDFKDKLLKEIERRGNDLRSKLVDFGNYPPAFWNYLTGVLHAMPKYHGEYVSAVYKGAHDFMNTIYSYQYDNNFSEEEQEIYDNEKFDQMATEFINKIGEK